MVVIVRRLDPRASVVLQSSEPCGAAGVVVVADDDDWGSVGGGGSTIRFACHCRGCGSVGHWGMNQTFRDGRHGFLLSFNGRNSFGLV